MQVMVKNCCQSFCHLLDYAKDLRATSRMQGFRAWGPKGPKPLKSKLQKHLCPNRLHSLNRHSLNRWRPVQSWA